jgi:subtilisin family serine protease
MEYVVLRDKQRGRARQGFFDDGLAVREWEVEIAHPEPRIEVERTDRKGRNDLARDPEVISIAALMPIQLIEPWHADTDTAHGDAWGIAAVRADVSAFAGTGVRVAVLDTGIDRAHSAFEGMDLIEKDFSGDGNGDSNGHGTHCAGTIFGRDIGGARIGVALGVQRALIGKVLTGSGAGTSEAAFRAINWAADQGAEVISMSFGFDFPGMVSARVQQGWPTDLATSIALEAYRGNLRMFDALMEMIRAREAFGPGCVVVAAAGNESRREISPDYEIAASLPAAADGVLSTGALARSPVGYTITSFSNSFPRVSAPGQDIKSAYPGGALRTMTGTSMACPHVAGVAALWWEAVRSLSLPATAATVTSRILATCRTVGLAPGAYEADRGSGLVTAP